MMHVKPLTVALLLVAGAVGCATGGQMENAVYDTHRRVANLDKSLEGAISKLNENTAELSARIDASDQQVKTLQGVVEENTVKLDALDKKLEMLSGNLSRMFRGGLMPSPGAATGRPPGIDMETDVTVVPPLGAPAAPVPAAPAPIAPAPVAPVPVAPPAAPAAPSVPAAPAAALPAGSGNAEADYQQARKSYASGDYASALDQFTGYLQRYPNAENRANAQFYKGVSLQNLGRYEEAIGEFDRLRSGYPESVRVPSAILNLGTCHKQLGQTERARELFQEVMRNYPMTPAADQAKSELKKLEGT